MDPSALSVCRAVPGDLETVLAIADETAKWLLSKGIRQWESPPAPEICSLLRREIANGNVYWFRLAAASDVAGLFRVEWQGIPLWRTERNAAYLHSLCVRPAYIGRGIGAALIVWLRNWLSGQGREFLRLDCIAANPVLRRWYEDLGFSCCGLATHGEFTMALYEIRC